VLARVEEAFQTGNQISGEEKMSAIGNLLEGLIDYAGLYPPASFDMPAAVRSYLKYGRCRHAAVLGRFIVSFERVMELRQAAGEALNEMALSVIATPHSDWACLEQLLDDGCRIDTIEIKADQPADVERICKRIPSDLNIYFETSGSARSTEMLAAIAHAGARVKLRMGGVEERAFPGPEEVAKSLRRLAERHVPFKATAGLHHPIRSKHRLTYESDSAAVKMHGFVNLCCAAALLHCGGQASDAKILLEEENPGSWQVKEDSIGWGSFRWSAEQLREVRAKSLISFGSCSFEEPINDLEALGWL
jgi:hypothetical protein